MISINFNRKSRYFVLFFTLRKFKVSSVNPEILKKVSEADPFYGKDDKKDPAAGPVPPHLESWLNVIVNPDKGKPAPHLGMKQALGMIMEKFPGYDHIALTNLKELSKKDFDQWNG